MISKEKIEELAKKYHTAPFPNVSREYFQHLFLSELYKLPDSEKLLFKGGTALRIIYGSPRFSEDLDFSIGSSTDGASLKEFIESIFIGVLSEIEKVGIKVELGGKSDATSGGYFGRASFTAPNLMPIVVEINVSARNAGELKGEISSIVGDFLPPYTVIHLSEEELVAEKIFGALLNRKKPRDFYDLYFMMRKGMLSANHKKKLAEVKEEILVSARQASLSKELGVFLPADQQLIVRNFYQALESELNRNIR